MHACVSLVIVVGELMHQIMDGINEMHSQVDWGVLGMYGMAACPWPPSRRRGVDGSVDVLLGNYEHVLVWTGVLTRGRRPMGRRLSVRWDEAISFGIPDSQTLGYFLVIYYLMDGLYSFGDANCT